MRSLTLLTAVMIPTLLPAQKPDANTAVLVASLNGFAAALHGELAKAGNPTCGPASVSIALLMLLEGAAGPTQQEIAAALRLPATLAGDALRAAAKDLLRQTVRADEDVTLTIVDDVWAQAGSKIADPYAAVVRDAFGAAVRRVDFAHQPAAARDEINGHIAKATRDRIRELLQPDIITAETRVVLTNAMWLKANWDEAFQKSKDLPFRIGKEDVPVPAMVRTDAFAFAETQTFAWARVRYLGGDLAMDLVLPAAGQPVAVAEAALLGAVPGLTDERIALRLPKFTAKARHRLPPTLRALGIRAAFDGLAADFSPINGVATGPEKLVVSEVAHQAWIQVDEAGTEAAAATAVVMKRLGAPPGPVRQLVFDREFAFAIRDLRTGLLLFVGRVTDPRDS